MGSILNPAGGFDFGATSGSVDINTGTSTSTTSPTTVGGVFGNVLDFGRAASGFALDAVNAYAQARQTLRSQYDDTRTSSDDVRTDADRVPAYSGAVAGIPTNLLLIGGMILAALFVTLAIKD